MPIMRINRPTRVLIVEDDLACARALQRVLRMSGCEVTAFATVRDSLENLKGHTHVLLDLLLEDGEGAEVLRAMRAAGNTAAVALVTAAPTDCQRMLDAMSLQPDAVFRKPVLPEALLEWLGTFPPQP